MKNRHAKGVTLIELVIVIVVIGIVATVVGPMMYSAATAANKVFTISQVDSQGKFALARIAEDIRNAESLHSSSRSSVLDLRDVGDNDDDVEYALSAQGYLTRTDNGATGDLASEVSALSFAYFDMNGDEVTAESGWEEDTVAYIRPTITITLNGHSEDFRTTVYLRNADIQEPDDGDDDDDDDD